MTEAASVEVRPATAGSTPSARGSPAAPSSPARCWYRAVTPLSLKRGRAGPEHRHVLRPGAERGPVADQLRGTRRAARRRAPRRSNLLIATTSAKSSMSIFSSCDAAPNSGVITYSATSASGDDRRVALPDAGRLQDHQVVAGGLARADDGLDVLRQFAARPGWPASGRTRGRRRGRSSGSGRRAARRRRGAGSGRRRGRRCAACPAGRCATGGRARRSATTCPSRRCR